jgi:hypothetical protein
MQKPPLDPDVADTAPSDSVLTVYDEEHVVAYLRLLDADAQGADWRELARMCCISIRNMNPTTPEGCSREMDDGARYRTCCVVARRRNAQKRAAYVGGFFVVSIGGTSPSSQSCSLAKASQAASIRLYRRCKGSFVAASASRAQFSAFSRKISDCFIASSCCEGRMRRARVYNAVFDDTFSTLMNGCSGRFISLP